MGISMGDMITTNQNALAALERDDFNVALELFRENARKFPCHLALNNLGEFYFDNGNRMKNGKWRCAQQLGLCYLQKARVIETNRVNLLNIGTALFTIGNLGEACNVFKLAEENDLTGIARYNTGVCLLAAKKYKEAESVFLDLTHQSYNGLLSLPVEYDPRVALLFSSLLSQSALDYSDRAELVEDVLAIIDDYDKIALLYLLGRYEELIDLSDLFLDQWIPSVELVAMILESAIRINGGKAEKVIERIQLNSDASVDEMIHSPQLLRKTALSFNYSTPLIEECGYYGCIQHHTPLPAMSR